ncbi:MAG: MerR family transcriptional regulator [Butyrivibrio sp.]|nr:MerR family transcriptional regulator [Butyrivibrio sp.]
MSEKNLYTIKNVTKLTGVTASTLRYYEELGILEDVERDKNDNRIYTDEHLDRLGGIRCFKDGAMPLSKIREFYRYESDLENHIDDIIELVEEQTEELTETINKMVAQKKHMEAKVKFYSAIKKAIENNSPWPSWDEYSD